MSNKLEQLREERDKYRNTALALIESDDYDPESEALKTAEERAAHYDGQIERLVSAMEAQESSDAMDTRLSRSARTRQERETQDVQTRESAGTAFTRSSIYAEYPGRGTSARFEVENLLDPVQHRAPLLLADFGDVSLATQRVVEGPALSPKIFDVVTVVPVTSNAVEVVTYDFTDNTADVAEGQPKPESDLAVNVEPLALIVQAHWVQLSRQVMEDAPAVRSRVDQGLRTGVLRKMASNAMAAILAADYGTAVSGGGSLLGGIRAAIGELGGDGLDGGYDANAVIMNPADWADIDVELLATTGNPAIGHSFWGLTPISFGAVPAGTAYVGDFKTAVEHYRRTSAQVYISDSHASTFTSNIFTLLGEGRSASAVVQPNAVREVTAA